MSPPEVESTGLATAAIRAQANIHHAYFLGLQLKAATQLSSAEMEDWMFRLFRRQHHDKFLSSFAKLGLDTLPDAVACAKYHVLSNSIGGVPVEYMPESDTKAWVRFRYPRWMYAGPTVCGLPPEVSRGFLRGWYAHNGVSLNNPRLGFVCVSEDLTGEYGLCGYFRQYEFDLTDKQRLQFAPDELPPPYCQDEQPTPPTDLWTADRLEKANRNYAIDYVRNGLLELSNTVGEEKCTALAGEAAYLIGLQYFQETRALIGGVDGDLDSAADYLLNMFSGLNDEVELVKSGGNEFTVLQSSLRLTRGLDKTEGELVLSCWYKLWLGTLASFQLRKRAEVHLTSTQIKWLIRDI